MASQQIETSLNEEPEEGSSRPGTPPPQRSDAPPEAVPKEIPNRGEALYAEFFGAGDDVECLFLTSLEKHLRKVFFKLGYRIGVYPVAAITLSVLFTIVCISGLHRIRFETDYDYLFSPVDLRSKEDRGVVERFFPVDYATGFDPVRETRKTPCQVQVWAMDNGSVLRTEVWNEIVALHEAVLNVSITWNGEPVTYGAICAQLRNECVTNPVHALGSLMPQIEGGNFNLGYPSSSSVPDLSPSFFGGVEFDDEEEVLLSAKAIFLDYWFRDREGVELRLWESKLADLCQGKEFSSIKVALLLRDMLPREMTENAQVLKTYFVILFILMTAYGALSIMSVDCVRSKPLLGFVGVVGTTLATGSSFGILMHCGVPYVFVNGVIPILMLAIGLQDTYYILSAWQETSPLEEIPLRMGLTFSRAVWSVTVTSLLSLVAFFTSHATRLPVVQIFCLYFGICILFKYIWLLTLFAGVLSLSGGAERKGLHCLTLKRVRPRSETGDRSFLYRIFCAGGIDPSSPQNPADNQAPLVKKIFRDYVGAALNHGAVKICVIIAFGCYLLGAIVTCFSLQEDLRAQKLLSDHSALHKFLEEDEMHAKSFPDAIQIILPQNLTYSDPYVQKLVLKLHSDLEALPDIWPDTLTQSWLRGFTQLVSGNPQLAEKIRDEKSFISVLMKDYFPLQSSPQELDAIFDANESTIVASRFIVYRFDNGSTLDRRKKLVEKIREVVDQFPFEAVAFSPFFVDMDVYKSMGQTSAQTLCLSLFIMIILAFVFIPSPSSALIVSLSIVSIEVGTLGFASAWGVTMDMVSIMALIVCVGLSVHHSIPVALAYLSAKVETFDGRLRQALYHVGLPVLQGTLSTILCILPLAFLPSYIFRAFFKLIFLATVFGAVHALFFVPVIISSLGPGFGQRYENRRLINA